MTIDKEIRGNGLIFFLPPGVDLNARLEGLESKKNRAVIRYMRGNPYDATCMVISVDGEDIAYVNADDKRFVAPLLKESADGTCEAEFLEVYRPVEGTPIVRYVVTVNLDDVDRLMPGELWNSWDYDGLQLLRIGDIYNADFCAATIMKAVRKGAEGICEETGRMIEMFAEATLIDMSVDTTRLYDDVLFLLETRHRAIWREYINTLQHASTVRRTDKKRMAFTENWWPEFLESEVVQRLCNQFGGEMARQGKVLTKSVLKAQLKVLDEVVLRLPYDLHLYADHIDELWSVIYYTQIPRDKFHKLLSALALRARLKRALADEMPLVVTNLKVVRRVENVFQKDSNAIVMNS